MKKILLVLIFVFAFAGFAFGAPPDDYNIYNFSDFKKESYQSIGNITAYFLHGFDFLGYDSTYPSLEKMTQAEVNAVVTGTTKIKKAPDSYGIVGYSQGGLRALAFSTYLKANYSAEEYKKLKAVVTYSGINQGMQALQDDLPGVKSRVMDEVNTLYDGFLALNATGLALLTSTTAITGLTIANVLTSPNIPSPIADIVMKFLPAEVKGYVAPALLGSNSGKSAKQLGLSQLDDMRPGSEYINKYVSNFSSLIYSIQTGTEIVIKTKWLGIIPVPYIEKVPVYKIVSFSQPTIKFPSNLPVGFIVGTNNSVKNLPSSEVTTIAKTLETTFTATEVFHIAHSAALIGLLTGSPSHAAKAKKAKQLVGDIDGMVNYLTRSYDGDGVIAKSNQYYPRTIKDPAGKVTTLLTNVLSDEDYMPVNANHSDIDSNPETYNHIRTLFSSAGLR